MMRGLVLGLLVLVPAEAAAQSPPPVCSGLPLESAWLAAGPVFRDCDVDKPAKRKGGEPKLDDRHFKELDPTFACKEIVLEFVVTADGLVDTTATRLISSDHQALTLAVRETLGVLRFEPATLNGEQVRQLVVYRRGATRGGGVQAFRVGRINPGGVSEPAPGRTLTAPRPVRSCEK